MGIGVLAWLVRNTQNRGAQNPILLAFFVIDFGGFLAGLFANIAGLMSLFGWSLVGIFLIFSVAYAYLYLFVKTA